MDDDRPFGVDIMSKIDEIKRELETLEAAQEALENAYFYFVDIDWPDGIAEPHHVEMEISDARCEIDTRIDEIKQGLEQI